MRLRARQWCRTRARYGDSVSAQVSTCDSYVPLSACTGHWSPCAGTSFSRSGAAHLRMPRAISNATTREACLDECATASLTWLLMTAVAVLYRRLIGPTCVSLVSTTRAERSESERRKSQSRSIRLRRGETSIEGMG